MLDRIIRFSLEHKLIVLLCAAALIGFGLYSLSNISIGAVPDVTNNQVQVITTSRNLSTQDMERFITYPVELEMTNLPGVVEIRSISKFGLSVVTIVFEDEMGTYLPRQLIAEKIRTAAERIPEGFGTPQMGPISTGLGEIYQYILDVEPAYRDRYSITDLRTIQDWIVKRQLAGIPGVVEVNTWGGSLKQYEIAIKTDRLKAMDITVGDLVNALERNNSVAGGGYIEKINQAYFIRGEGLIASLEDIENTVVKNRNGIPIYIRDVASVGFGSANRFGAITGNGEGEKVLGQVMMLKGANTKQVIDAVKQRVEAISNSLPEGVYINAFLDRSELIARTTSTVEENLLLGCLIVIFVVVLLLGNLRSGLVVASVIPLSLLFALSLMYIFGVDANLMSLGAIDFGIIIDGAVIIVEFIAFQITQKLREAPLSSSTPDQFQAFKDQITFESASKMMNSAIFGQLIILIVFIPILALSGVEGKMFRPMALTFSFALIGAMILCFTYVPVMASLILKPSNPDRSSFSDRMLSRIYAGYLPIISWSLRHKKTVLGLAATFLLMAGGLFLRMGGEFVPTLDEGDFVIQPILKTGTSLSKTIETTTQIEKILMETFPEVDQVVTRIGAAEVPTDPMSMEESDVIIRLKPRSEWVTARSKDELANRFKEALAVIPGMEVEFTQPIEMRFNELITGVRADIAIKVFGEDLSVLAGIGESIAELARDVPGAADITVEKIEGLPQLKIVYKRQRIARYGLNIEDINEMISLAYAGYTAGQIFEGERRFDLVLRLDQGQRSDLNEVRQLYIDLPGGGKIPLEEVADIRFEKGAAKISRDDTRRRMVVGINVRDRDLQSVVDDLQELIDREITLPPGYSIAYGGQFENLQTAKDRLKVAVPIALALIFLMLYFAFGSLKEALLIYSAIPLAAVGGVVLLWLRDMPFSISAGVGFIALFGIAVLNGIVLIEHFKDLKKEGETDMEELVKKGAKDRLRAVLLTASAAALGFLPMAISTNAGAEVQRPLATVVIGGLVSATLLTLVVLPVLFTLFSKPVKVRLRPRAVKLLLCLGLLGITSQAAAQQSGADLDSLISLATLNNAGLEASRARWEGTEAARGLALDFGRTEVFYGYDANNIANGLPLQVFGLRQGFEFPTVYAKRHKARYYQAQAARYQFETDRRDLSRKVSAVYSSYQIGLELVRIYKRLDSLYQAFAQAADRRFELGATNYLEKVTARSRRQQAKISLTESRSRVSTLESQLRSLVQADSALLLAQSPPGRIPLQPPLLDSLPQGQLIGNELLAQKFQRQTAQHQFFPELSVQYFQGTNEALSGSLEGYSFGVSIPLFFNGQASRIRAAKLAESSKASEKQEFEVRIAARLEQLQTQLRQQDTALEYYEAEGNELAIAIFRAADMSFKNGEINFFQYIQSLENASEIRIAYLKQLESYNQTVLNINYITY
jgi:cobalt-zinc-cadmium resistance protein CzcA